ncbi:hypothetical protein BC830DRAFT_1171967 [Chytriomyces sp. MP71]|nr:hypothetical protein BC830DRAFT_1171967 [Chytriomyces sp. MP71]
MVDYEIINLQREYDVSMTDRFYSEILVPCFGKLPEELEDLTVMHQQLSTTNKDPSAEYILYVIVVKSTETADLLAGVCCEYYLRSNRGLVSYIATDPWFDTRGKGFGKILVDQAVAALQAEAYKRDHADGCNGIFCETNTDAVSADRDVMLPARRRAILQEFGFRCCKFDYVQPALGPGMEPCRTLYLGVLDAFLLASTNGIGRERVVESWRLATFLRDFFTVLMGSEGIEQDEDAVRQLRWLEAHAFIEVHDFSDKD